MLECRVQCPGAGGDAAQALQRAVDRAASENRGTEALFECAQALLQELEASARPPAPPQQVEASAAGARSIGVGPGPMTGTSGNGGGQGWGALLRLDHMRDPRLYARTIGRWMRGLGISGRLLTCPPHTILIMIQGGPDAVKVGWLWRVADCPEPPCYRPIDPLSCAASSLQEYLVLHRTQNVDIDSRGRPCKERLMDVIWEASERPTHATGADHGVPLPTPPLLQGRVEAGAGAGPGLEESQVSAAAEAAFAGRAFVGESAAPSILKLLRLPS